MGMISKYMQMPLRQSLIKIISTLDVCEDKFEFENPMRKAKFLA